MVLFLNRNYWLFTSQRLVSQRMVVDCSEASGKTAGHQLDKPNALGYQVLLNVVGGIAWKSTTGIQIVNVTNQPTSILDAPTLAISNGGTVADNILVFNAKLKKCGELNKLKCRSVILGDRQKR